MAEWHSIESTGSDETATFIRRKRKKKEKKKERVQSVQSLTSHAFPSRPCEVCANHIAAFNRMRGKSSNPNIHAPKSDNPNQKRYHCVYPVTSKKESYASEQIQLVVVIICFVIEKEARYILADTLTVSTLHQKALQKAQLWMLLPSSTNLPIGNVDIFLTISVLTCDICAKQNFKFSCTAYFLIPLLPYKLLRVLFDQIVWKIHDFYEFV